jgi:hypothetical protein
MEADVESGMSGMAQGLGMIIGLVLSFVLIGTIVMTPIVMLLIRSDIAAIRRLLEKQAGRAEPPAAP